MPTEALALTLCEMRVVDAALLLDACNCGAQNIHNRRAFKCHRPRLTEKQRVSTLVPISHHTKVSIVPVSPVLSVQTPLLFNFSPGIVKHPPRCEQECSNPRPGKVQKKRGRVGDALTPYRGLHSAAASIGLTRKSFVCLSQMAPPKVRPLIYVYMEQ